MFPHLLNMNLLPTDAEIFFFASAVSVASFGFLFYYYFSGSSFIKKVLKSGSGETRYVIFQRLLGAFIFGCLPFVIIFLSATKSISDFGVVFPNGESFFWILILSIAILAVNYSNSRTPGNLKMYPQIREKEWSLQVLTLSALCWIAYLTAYEFLFRGYLLFSSVRLLGLWTAIVLNTSIYALVHIPKGLKETAGAIPLGILLCFLTLRTGSIWIAVFVHITMALSNEWLSLRVHPEMSIKKARK